ncbi:MAG TPA: thiamine-phosphate kinase [Euzebya sp.]|nr:thiamine-phosphate kinase [Euzebya sp.]
MTGTGEFARLARLTPFLAADGEGVPVGAGDDAAVVRIGDVDVVVCIDTVVEGVHFRRDVSGTADVGWKAMAVNVSDVAAMGAVPRAAVVGLNRTRDLSEDDIDGLYAGLAEAGRRWGVPVVGGDTTTGHEWMVAVTVLGQLDGHAPVRRSGARVGDVVVLAGRIGAAAAAVQAMGQGTEPDARHLAAHRRPQALPVTGQALARAGVTAMIDLSDGLGADAGHLARASDVSLRLDGTAVRSVVAPGVRERVGPGWLDLAVGGGEDFALLATVSRDRAEAALAAVRQAGETTAAVIGTVTAQGRDGQPAVWLADGAEQRRVDDLGYDHG